MTRIVLIITVLAFSFTLIGCQAPKAKPAIPTASESAAIENVNVKRMAYLQSLAQSTDYYTRTGNQMKLNWALREMTAITTAANVPVKAVSAPLDASERDLLEQLAQDRQAYLAALDQLAAATNNKPAVEQAGKEIAAVKANPQQYTYIVEAQVAGPDLRAINAVPEADRLLEQARKLDNDARAAVVVADQAKLRQAIGIYDQLIKQYPTSDKIGLAAYYAGFDYEDLKDYTIAALYYERAAQWDAGIKVPTRFRAAYMYDRFLNNRQKALLLYQDSLNHEFSNSQYRAYANNRIIILSKKEVQ